MTSMNIKVKDIFSQSSGYWFKGQLYGYDDAIHGAVDKVDEAMIHALQTEGENLIIKKWVHKLILKEVL